MSWCSGAKAAIFYNLKHPDKILSQIFIAGEFAPFTGSEPYHSKFRENIQLIADLIQNDERMLDFYMKIIHKGMFNHPVKDFSSTDEMYIYEIMPEEHRNILLSPFTSKETMVNFLMMCMEYYQYDVTEELKNIKVPTLFVSAECDQVAPYMQSKWAHSHVKDSVFVCFPSGTHLLILERTLDVYEIIMQHMKFNNFEMKERVV
jgi:pimeloyl-ACP methyl ester carboxylesterase